jgi:hypothetical protein
VLSEHFCPESINERPQRNERNKGNPVFPKTIAGAQKIDYLI